LSRGRQPEPDPAAQAGQPYVVRVSARRKWARRLGVLLAVAVVIGGVGAAARWRIDVSDTCRNSGVTIVTKQGPDHQCVGITDGSYAFAPRLAAVENLIKHEDNTVAKTGNYVSVAYLEPMTLGPDPLEPFAALLHGLEGAYAAQKYVNSHSIENNQYPLIRLLLVNDGAAAGEWLPAVHDIEADEASQRIVAVAGLGQSLSTTAAAVRALQRAGLPMVGALITADSFSSIDGLIRVSPTNSDEAAGALSFVRPTAADTVLVENTNPDDSYSTTLGSQFQRYFRTGPPLRDPQTYDSGLATAVFTNQITQDAANVCQPGKKIVLFAGRGSQLAILLRYLANRSCSHRQLTIITGDDASGIAGEPVVRTALNSGIKLYYTGLASPGEWAKGTGAAIAAGRAALGHLTAIFGKSFPGQTLNDGQATMAYDALLTVTSAIRVTQRQAPTPTAVKAGLSLLNGADQVDGASGVLNFADNSGPGGSNPVGKAIPILQIMPGGQVHFVKIAWPSG
jgi:hypothetical protein